MARAHDLPRPLQAIHRRPGIPRRRILKDDRAAGRGSRALSGVEEGIEAGLIRSTLRPGPHLQRTERARPTGFGANLIGARIAGRLGIEAQPRVVGTR